MAINANGYKFLHKVSLWRSATNAEPSMVFILIHLLTTFSKDILILTTSKPTYKLFAGLNGAFRQLYFQIFALKVPSRLQNHQFGSFYVVSEVRCGVLVITTTQHHSTKPEFRFCIVQILFVACWRFPVVWISDNGPGWK